MNKKEGSKDTPSQVQQEKQMGGLRIAAAGLEIAFRITTQVFSGCTFCYNISP